MEEHKKQIEGSFSRHPPESNPDKYLNCHLKIGYGTKEVCLLPLT